MKKIYSFVFYLLSGALALPSIAQNITPITIQPISAQQAATLTAATQKRLPTNQACMEVTQTAVKLVLWDCGVEDNDTVSVQLNGQWILSNFRLTNAKQEMDVVLAPGENQLLLFANNLGDLHDNTAAMAIKENGHEGKATLSSNLHTNGTLRLLVTGSNPIGQVMTGCPKEQQIFMDDENQQVRANPDLANPKYNFLYSGLKKHGYEPNRSVEVQGCTNVSDSVVTLYFWDSGVEDNDTISINLNGVWVVQNLRLKKEKQAVQVKLQPGSNYIIMYANNLGDIPNNTSGVGVEYKFGKQDLGTLYSDKNTSGSFRFNCTAGASPEVASAPCIKTQNNTARHQTDPEMQYLNGTKASNPSQQPTQYNPQRPTNHSTTVGTGVSIGIGVGSTIGNSGNTGGNSGSTGGSKQPSQRSGSGTQNPGRSTPPRPNH